MDNTRLAHLCGPLDENLRQISAALDVTIFRRGEKFIVSGSNAERAVELLERFYAVANKVVPIEEVQLALVEQRSGLKPTIEAPAAPAASELDDEETNPELTSPTLKTAAATCAAAPRTRSSTCARCSNTTSASVSGLPAPARPTWRWPARSTRSSATRSSASS